MYNLKKDHLDGDSLTTTGSYTGGQWLSFDMGTKTLRVEISKTGLPEKVIFQDEKETVVLKQNGETTIVRAHDDEYDRVYGFLLAYFQANSGLSKTKANKYLEDLRSVPSQTKNK